MDRRLWPDSGQRALSVLRGQTTSRLTDGVAAQIATPLADLCAHPDGPRDRQLLHGAQVCGIDARTGWSFVRAEVDSYCGWVQSAALGPHVTPTHRVVSLASHLYSRPDLKSPERAALPMNSLLALGSLENGFAQTQSGAWVPLAHVRPLDETAPDPVNVARQFLGVPYLWGGNSWQGIDCSGLVQVALHTCGIACPADSDLQREALGPALSDDAPFARGDIIFWQGHVAFVSGPDTLLHATAFGMAVIEEPLFSALARIDAQAHRLAVVRLKSVKGN
ncbi:MAG: C40 family peptidase [Roseinatronobacter sp.]